MTTILIALLANACYTASVVLVTLKLTGAISISWITAFSPIWLPIALLIIVVYFSARGANSR